MENQSLIETFVEIDPVDSDSFLKIKETLTRIGIASRKAGELPTLWQSCHILHKRGRYFIVHFKQMFLLDGKVERTDFTDCDKERTDVVSNLLHQWGLVNLKDMKDVSKLNVNLVVISHANKNAWNLKSKYNVGKKDQTSNY